MSTICDSCKQPISDFDGCGRLSITDPLPDYTNLDAEHILASRPPRRAPTLDICPGCLVTLIGVLKLPADTFVPRPPPPPPPQEPPPVGALTHEDLIKLGLVTASGDDQ